MAKLSREDMQAFANEMKNVDWTSPEDRRAIAYIAGAYVKGSFVARDGVFSESDINALPTGQKS